VRRSNCIACALILYARLRRRWVARGRPPGREPYLLARGSRLGPTWVPHVLVGKWTSGGRMVVVSFKPADHRRLPWWSWWRVLFFDGQVVRGD
jgi:hypothetical protein